MQRKISNKTQLGKTLNPLSELSVVLSVDNTSSFRDLFGKVDTVGDLWDRVQADASLI